MRSMQTALRETINGVVAADGTVSAGVGFMVVKAGTGSYVIRLFGKRPFTASVISINNPIMAACVSYDRQASSGVFQVILQDRAGTAVDQSFSFICECVPAPA